MCSHDSDIRLDQYSNGGNKYDSQIFRFKMVILKSGCFQVRLSSLHWLTLVFYALFIQWSILSLTTIFKALKEYMLALTLCFFVSNT